MLYRLKKKLFIMWLLLGMFTFFSTFFIMHRQVSNNKNNKNMSMEKRMELIRQEKIKRQEEERERFLKEADRRLGVRD